MSVYTLNCTVCGGEYDSKTNWNNHLTTASHQKFARLEVSRNSKDMTVKDSCLVVFFNMPIVHSSIDINKMLQHFSNHWSTFISDFVWWEERSRIGLVRFESRKNVVDLVSKLPSYETRLTEVLIDNLKVHAKLASTISDLEWHAIFPTGLPTERLQSFITPESKEPIIVKEGFGGGFGPSTRTTSRDDYNKSFEISSSDSINSIAFQDESTNCDQNLLKSNLEITALKKRIQEQRKGPDRSDKKPVSLLNKFTQKRRWRPPIYSFRMTRGLNNRFEFSCSLTVNGKLYKPERFTCVHSKKQVKHDTAAFCLQKLTR